MQVLLDFKDLHSLLLTDIISTDAYDAILQMNLNTSEGKAILKKQEELEAIEVLEFLNRIAGKNFRPVESQLKFIKARLKEKDVDVQTLKQVIQMKFYDWGKDIKMKQYLRPETLFNPTKFESYLERVKYVQENPQQFKQEHEQRVIADQRNQKPNSPEQIQQIKSNLDRAFGAK